MRRLVALLLVAAALGCKPSAVKLEVMPSSLRFTSSGDTVILIPTLTDASGQPVPQHPPCAFVTGDPLVADVRQDGTVTANGAGTTEIKVHCEKLAAGVPVKVSLPSKVSIEAKCDVRCGQIAADPLSLKLDGIGASAKLIAHVTDESGDAVAVEPRWEAADPDFRAGARRLGIEVGKEGELRSNGIAGRYLVIVSAGTIVSRASVEVTLPTVDVVHAQRRIWVKPGGEGQVVTEGFRRAIDGLKPVAGARYSYSSNNPEVVKVGDEGKLTAVAPGTADIVVAADSGAFAQVTVTVADEEPQASAPTHKAPARKQR